MQAVPLLYSQLLGEFIRDIVDNPIQITLYRTCDILGDAAEERADRRCSCRWAGGGCCRCKEVVAESRGVELNRVKSNF